MQSPNWSYASLLHAGNYTLTNAAGGTKTSYRLHEPGFTFSGPVRIPKVYNGRDKTFFMYTLDIFRTGSAIAARKA